MPMAGHGLDAHPPVPHTDPRPRPRQKGVGRRHRVVAPRQDAALGGRNGCSELGSSAQVQHVSAVFCGFCGFGTRTKPYSI